MAARPWASRWRRMGSAAGRSARGAITIQSAWFAVLRSEEGVRGRTSGWRIASGETAR
jgi:hypothetical protein